MSVTLSRMSETEYSEFYRMSFENHVEELIRKENLLIDEAERETRAELDEMLPLGLDTPDNYLLSVGLQDIAVGYIWFLTELVDGVRQAFICDFLIYENYRGRGYGQSALSQMEKKASELMCSESILFVEEDNTAARKLYSKCGYNMVRRHNYGYFMKKPI